ncbi:hypothetical protein [Xanthomarina sp. F2636L]|uniref:hypothetical protein n=1 Tax=Xanthomarina sp. F2636L TaxID=2996018 RepID=UPI00225DE5B1|nr:hypothetical protein [Xanthomarina sp. F2636L]MCX7550684.1 hypothetical protein [Xanthomarina sp. F2636L]
MTKYLVFLFALTANFSFSQASSAGSVDNFSNASKMIHNNGLWVSGSSADSNIKGSPYLFDSWNSEDGVIYMNDNKAYRLKSLNYNVQLERFEAKFSEDSVLALNPRNIDKIVIDNRTFKRYLDPEFQRNSYFENLVTTKSITILRKYEIEIIEANFNPMTQQKVSDDQMVKKEKYYYSIDDETLKEIKLKKSHILKTLDSDKKDAIKQYAKDNNLSFKNVVDLKTILQYYNTL